MLRADLPFKQLVPVCSFADDCNSVSVYSHIPFLKHLVYMPSKSIQVLIFQDIVSSLVEDLLKATNVLGMPQLANEGRYIALAVSTWICVLYFTKSIVSICFHREMLISKVAFIGWTLLKRSLPSFKLLRLIEANAALILFNLEIVIQNLPTSMAYQPKSI